jgi:hypothetical protein
MGPGADSGEYQLGVALGLGIFAIPWGIQGFSPAAQNDASGGVVITKESAFAFSSPYTVASADSSTSLETTQMRQHYM